jgi:Probable cobalt transporter subunit (CbtA)
MARGRVIGGKARCRQFSRLQTLHPVPVGIWNAGFAGGGTFILLAIAAQILLPAINQVPERFPAAVLWQFGIASVGIEAVLWVAIGLVFGPLAETVLRRAQKGQ